MSLSKNSFATEAAVMGGGGGSSVAVERDVRPAMPEGLDRARLEETRRTLGDLGGVEPPVPFKELNEDFLRSVGVEDPDLEVRDCVEGVRRNFRGDGGFISLLRRSNGMPGEEGGSSVAAAVPRDMRLILAVKRECSLFVDFGEGNGGSVARVWSCSMLMSEVVKEHLNSK